MNLFSSGRGKIDKWYKDEMKKLNDNYYAHRDSGDSKGAAYIQRANEQQQELERAKKTLTEEYLKRLEAIGKKPRSDFSS
jgi:hypothetical protein